MYQPSCIQYMNTQLPRGAVASFGSQVNSGAYLSLADAKILALKLRECIEKVCRLPRGEYIGEFVAVSYIYDVQIGYMLEKNGSFTLDNTSLPLDDIYVIGLVVEGNKPRFDMAQIMRLMAPHLPWGFKLEYIEDPYHRFLISKRLPSTEEALAYLEKTTN
jgi:hypothetical protein